jgi:hypothetical protein
MHGNGREKKDGGGRKEERQKRREGGGRLGGRKERKQKPNASSLSLAKLIRKRKKAQMTITRHEGGDITTDSIDIKKIAI